MENIGVQLREETFDESSFYLQSYSYSHSYIYSYSHSYSYNY